MQTGVLTKFSSLAELFADCVPEYRPYGWSPFIARFRWDRRDAEFVESVSPGRVRKRLATYIIPGELERSKGSIRFGLEKTGHGFTGERKDFCLIGGAYRNGMLTVFYRRLELIGGLHYDLAIFREVEDKMGPVKSVTIMAAKADTFTAKGNSNEKLFHKLREYYADQA